MRDSRQDEPLLSDILSEGMAAGFREGMLNQTLRLARRRRRGHQMRRAAAALAVVAMSGLLVWHILPLKERQAGFAAKPYALVRTQTLPPEEWVVTKPLPVTSMIASLPPMEIIITERARIPVERLSDDELLALAPQPAALVRFGPHNAELVLVGEDAAKELLRY